jgi:exodeoxyribonuclease VII large subunit
MVFSVSDLTRNVRFLLEENFSGVWIEGEISNFKSHSSGHLYFSLKDEEAQLSAVMFRREAGSLPFVPEEGLNVVAYGRISVYAPRGQYQFYVDRMEPKGLGALQLRFEQLKEKLRLEGLFEAERKRPLPFLPARIGVVTSLDGAALRDILHVLDRRYREAHILIYPVAVQGISAAGQIAAAIDDLNALKACDVLIVGRGGGSLEDLWAFNEEIVARAIYCSEIPVISAVGHEVDFTIADFVADFRAPTPSAAAEIVLPVKEELLARVEELKARSLQATLSFVAALREDVDRLAKTRGLRDPLFYFQMKVQRLDELKKNVSGLVETLIMLRKERLAALAGKLDALGPLATLTRGFSVTQKVSDGRVVTDASSLKIGERLRIKFYKGTVITEVKEKGE